MKQLWLPGFYVDGLGTVTSWSGRTGTTAQLLILGHTLVCDAQGIIIPVQALQIESAGVLAVGQVAPVETGVWRAVGPLLPLESGATVAVEQELPTEQRTTLAAGTEIPTEPRATVIAGNLLPTEQLAGLALADEIPVESDAAVAVPIAVGQTFSIELLAGVGAQLELAFATETIAGFEPPVRGGFVMIPRHQIDWDEEIEELLLAGVL